MFENSITYTQITEALPDKIEFRGEVFWFYYKALLYGGHRISYASQSKLLSSHIIFDEKDLQYVASEMKKFKNIVTV